MQLRMQCALVGTIALGSLCSPLLGQLTFPYSGAYTGTAEAFLIQVDTPLRAIRGVNTNSSGAGIGGVCTSPTGVTFGLYGSAASTQGTGLYGWSNGTGLWGQSPGGVGIKAESATGTALQVVGTSTFSGQVAITGGDVTFNTSGDIAARIRNSFDIRLEHDMDNNNTTSWFRVFTNGAAVEQLRINDGDEAAVLGDGTFSSNGIDYAEAFKVSEDLAPGDVVSLHVGYWEYCRQSTTAYDPHALGVVSEKPGFVTGFSFDVEEAADAQLAQHRVLARMTGNAAAEKQLSLQLAEVAKATHRPIALLGRVPCKVVGTIQAGDFLTTSDTPGHAMAMTQAGPSLGVALEDSTGPGPATVMAFIQPGWRVPPTAAQAVTDVEIAALQAQLAEQQAELKELKALVAGLIAQQSR